jgi:hypothetical protein
MKFLTILLLLVTLSGSKNHQDVGTLHYLDIITYIGLKESIVHKMLANRGFELTSKENYFWPSASDSEMKNQSSEEAVSIVNDSEGKVKAITYITREVDVFLKMKYDIIGAHESRRPCSNYRCDYIITDDLICRVMESDTLKYILFVKL